jgi:hypothetical protein
VDINTSDTTKSIILGYIYQVNSNSNYTVYYFNIEITTTTHLFIICRYQEDMYKPRVKMRDRKMQGQMNDKTRIFNILICELQTIQGKEVAAVHVTCMFLMNSCIAHGRWASYMQIIYQNKLS